MYQSLQTTEPFYIAEPENTYYRSGPAARRYLPGNSYNTYRMVKKAIPEKEGHWLMLFDAAAALAHTERLPDSGAGFGAIKFILQTAFKHQCLSVVLVNFTEDYYRANSADMVYNVRFIAAARAISMVLLDHLVIEPDGYYSYRDNGLLAYLGN